MWIDVFEYHRFIHDNSFATKMFARIEKLGESHPKLLAL